MIKANFNAYSSYVTDSLYQWDLNQRLTINGLNLTVVPEVHFSNSDMDRAIVRQATMTNHVVTVDIPNSLLQSPLTIRAHVGIYEGNTFKVIELIEIPVIPRTRPFDYKIETTDDEVYSFEALKNKVANMVTRANFENDKKLINARIDTLIAHNNDTSNNSELVDSRIGIDGTVYKSVGTAVREQLSTIDENADNPSLYTLDVVKNYIGIEEVFNGSLRYEHTDASKSWKYTHREIILEPGTYTLVLRNANLSSVGYLAVKETTTAMTFLEVNKPGVYTFTVYDSTYSTGNNVRTLIMQVSTDEMADVGVYSVDGVHIFKGNITDSQAFPDNIIGNHKKLDKIIGKNKLCLDNAILHYFVSGANGKQMYNEDYTDFYMTDYIPIKADTTYAYSDYHIGGAGIAFYDGLKNYISGYSGSLDPLDSNIPRLLDTSGVFTTPSNAVFIRLSGTLENYGLGQLEEGNAITEFEEYTEYAPIAETNRRVSELEKSVINMKNDAMFYREKADSLNDSESLTIDIDSHTKWGYTIGFMCTLSNTFGSVRIARGINKPYCSAYVVIDSVNINVYRYTTGAILVSTIPHSLTLSGFLTVSICAKNDNTALITVTSSGGTFTDSIEWNASNGIIDVTIDGMSVTNVELTYGVNAINKNIWIFGDSYFDFWTRDVVKLGFFNFLEDAYSGRGSNTAFAALEEYLNYRTPQKIAWFMGMNNSDNGSINSEWKTAIDKLVTLCANKKIELILTTVPSTPTNDNSYKNEYVKSLGLRYIDVSRAVGADKSVSWYSGLLGGDNVHPTALGSMVIAQSVINAFPEICEK